MAATGRERPLRPDPSPETPDDRRRALVLLCPDWPVSAAAAEAELPASRPAAIFTGNIVTCCSATARRAGVTVGQRRRRAQQRCPELAILRPDPDRDARLFEPVVHSVGEVVAAVRPVHPGVLTVPASAARYFGRSGTGCSGAGRSGADLEAERTLAERLVAAVTDDTGHESLLGIADGLFAGLIAATRSARVSPGCTPAYLAGLDVGELDRPEIPELSGRHELISLLRRLGLTTLGAFAALDPAAVAGRFGADAARAHRQARGLPDTPMGAARPPAELAVDAVVDPPADRVEMAAFAARPLAEKFLTLVTGRSLTCTQVRIEAQTDAGDVSVRIWRAGASFTASDIAERLRWQLDGWLSGATTGSAPNGPITLLRLEADEVTSPTSLQPTIWDDKREDDELVRRTISRLQGLLGMDTVLAGTLLGGPDATDDTEWTPWQQAAPVPRPGPWPGRLPSPHPAALMHCPASLVDAAGRPIGVSARGELDGVPARLRPQASGGLGRSAGRLSDRPAAESRRDAFRDAKREHELVAWSRGWPVVGRWWDAASDRRVRLQVLTVDGDAYLLGYRAGRWSIDGSYD